MTDHTYALKFPLPGQAGGPAVTAVTIHRPKVREIRAFEKARSEKGEFEASLDMLAALCGLAPEQLDELDTVDFQALSEVLAGFTEGASA